MSFSGASSSGASSEGSAFTAFTAKLDLAGRTALVCGASQGIGAATAGLLAAQGARVIALARSQEALRSVVEGLPGEGHQILVCDVTDRALLKEKISTEIQAAGGAIEILVNNSGGPKGGPILEANEEEFAHAFSQHLLVNQLLAQLLVPGMKVRGYGRILNVISTSVKIPIPGLGVSNTVRWAVASWAKTLALEVAPYGITVNSVLPGYTRTQRLAALIKANADKRGVSEAVVTEEWIGATPARRFGEAEEVAAAIAFLASPAAAFITGVALPVDGGRTGSL